MLSRGAVMNPIVIDPKYAASEGAPEVSLAT
ncbi:unannotated protein [freshwater metagenome]|uniref:Unannotated protein n=1 Tax=freshwater metagenome TaxID=449393 RepID=A0A6J6E4T0_9ZZZZ